MHGYGVERWFEPSDSTRTAFNTIDTHGLENDMKAGNGNAWLRTQSTGRERSYVLWLADTHRLRGCHVLSWLGVGGVLLL